jgi:hypothetical protein
MAEEVPSEETLKNMRSKFIGAKKLQRMTYSDPQQIGQSYFKDYNVDRFKDCRMMGIYLCFIEMILMLAQVVNPWSDVDTWLNIYVMSNFVLCSLFYLYSFRQTVDIKIIIIPTLLMMTRYQVSIVFFVVPYNDDQSQTSNILK